jgi:hypothetical protein
MARRSRRTPITDIRCRLGWHAWVKKQVEESQYLECTHCRTDRAALGQAPGSL